jgi:uncharacterized membrane protein YfcA
VFIGGIVGFIIGCSGVGGAALMTPSLILLGVEPLTAIGTDLLFCFITKIVALTSYHSQNNINWSIVKRMCMGSFPAAVLVLIFIHLHHYDVKMMNNLINYVLGYILLLVSVILFLKNILKEPQKSIKSPSIISQWILHHIYACTVFGGFFIGLSVTLTSVGAGSVGVIIIYALYPHLRTIKIVGTDIAQALLITFVAGIGHSIQGNIDYKLLLLLLSGSIPCVLLSSYYVKYLPEKIISNILICILIITGLKFILK